MTTFPPIESLVLHRGTMLLVSAILEHEADLTTCSGEIARDSVVVKGGRVGRWVAIEYMAQTIAVHAGLSAWERNEPVKLGFLIGSRRVEFRRALHVGQAVAATARRVWGQANLGLFACTLRDRVTGDVIAEGELSVALSDAATVFGRRSAE